MIPQSVIRNHADNGGAPRFRTLQPCRAGASYPLFWALVMIVAFSPPLAAADRATESRTVERRGLKVRVEGASDDPWKILRAVVELQLSLVEDRTATPPLADDLAFFLRKEYLKLGYPAASVTWEIAGDEAVLTAFEGERETIGETFIEGTDAATQKEMRDYLLRPTEERMGSLGKHAPLVEAEIHDGAGLVQRLIQSRGYLSATVSEPEFQRTPGQPTNIKVTVREGPRSTFGDVFINGKLPADDAEIRAAAAALKGQPYSEVRMEEIRANVAGKCQASGHFAAKVTATARPGTSGGTVPVILAVEPGPVYHVAGIQASEDFSRGAQRIIEAGFRPAEGRVWSTTGLDLMQRRVMDTGVFSQIEIEPVSASEREASLVLRMSGREAPRRTLGLFGGYETLRGATLGIEWRHVNFANTGDTLRVRAGYEAGGMEGGIRWINPALFNSAYASDTEVSATTFSLYDYTHDSLKLRTALSRQITRQFAVSVHAHASTDTASSGTLTPAELGPDAYKMLAAGGTVSLDYRDSPVLPRRGWMTSLAIESGMADISYFRTDFRVSFYHPFTEHFRIAANFQAAAITAPEGVENLPIDARLFNGGASTVRSFPERELGLMSASDTPLGGTLMHAANVELSWEFLENLEAAVFADAGSLSREDDNLFALPEDLRYALGLGIRYALPVGPLRVDYGFNPSRRAGEPSGALHVTFGFAF